MNKRLVVAALAALALVAGTAHAAKPGSSNQLRTTRIATLTAGSGTLTMTLSSDSLAGPKAQGVRYEGNVKTLLVVDWISYTVTAGVGATVATVAISDDSGTSIFLASQTVAATATATLFYAFQSGVPMFNARAGGGPGSVILTKDDVAGTTGAAATFIGLASAAITNPSLFVGYHMEAVSDRTP